MKTVEPVEKNASDVNTDFKAGNKEQELPVGDWDVSVYYIHTPVSPYIMHIASTRMLFFLYISTSILTHTCVNGCVGCHIHLQSKMIFFFSAKS